MTRRLTVLLAGLGAAAALLAGCTGSSGHSSASPKPSNFVGDATANGSFQGIGVTPPRPRPAFTMTDAAGKPYDFLANTQGRPTLLYFGYTTCPDICPATMADVGIALSKVPAALQKQTVVVFVSTDVKHDTAAVITQWLHNFDTADQATWVGLHGTTAQVDAAQAAAHIFLASDDGQTHSAQVLLYGADNYTRDSFLYTSSNEQAQIQHDLPLVASS